ncbi:hypothetical protein L1987_44854 [Smallanthus sonchifolius]|uniref:Uncharacterized protein n=1 Tax=Smallanthus sonchifolius TaxID=185202 RepID=A0ACB9GQF3_9ASTR|nr:hypothetical protein L1987_44854 [Smallanthus sonchifolius]
MYLYTCRLGLLCYVTYMKSAWSRLFVGACHWLRAYGHVSCRAHYVLWFTGVSSTIVTCVSIESMLWEENKRVTENKSTFCLFQAGDRPVKASPLSLSLSHTQTHTISLQNAFVGVTGNLSFSACVPFSTWRVVGLIWFPNRAQFESF